MGDLYLATITTANVRANEVYSEVDTKDEAVKMLLEAGFLVKLSAADIKKRGIVAEDAAELEPVEAPVVVETPAAKTAVPKVPTDSAK